MPIKNNGDTTTQSSSSKNNNSTSRSSTASRKPRTTSNRSNNASRGNGSRNNNYQSNNGSDSSYYKGEMIPISGILEVMPDFGVIRQDERVSDELPKDVYTSPSQIRRCNLRMGDFVTGCARAPNEGERYLSLLKVEKVDGMSPDEAKKRPHFSKMTPVFPDEWMKMETDQKTISTRLSIPNWKRSKGYDCSSSKSW